jgi:hypothetical protein
MLLIIEESDLKGLGHYIEFKYLDKNSYQWWALKRKNYRIIFSAMIFSEKRVVSLVFLKFRCVDCSQSFLFATLKLSKANFLTV